MTWKSYAAVSGAGLLATYLFSTPPPLDDRAPVPARPAGAAAAPLANDIERQADRLGSRTRPTVEYQPPERNPFRFGGRTAPAAREAVQAPAPVEAFEPELPPLPPAPPPIRLTGIAIDTVDGERRRTAILLTANGLVSAGEGETAGAYRIVRIDEDAVEVVGPDGASRRLLLRP